MIGLGDPERIVIDCAGDEWYVRGPDGAVRTVAAPAGADEFAAPAESTRRWAGWLSAATAGSPPARAWTVLAPSVFGAPRRSLVAAAAGSLGVGADVVPRAEALVRAAGLLYCRRALVVECRGSVARAHVLDFADERWRPVAVADHPDPARAALAALDDRVDQALVDGPPDAYARIRDALADAGLWRVVRVEPTDVLTADPVPARAEEPVPEPDPVAPRGRRFVAAGAVASLVCVAAAGVACFPRARTAAPDRPEAAPERFVQVSFDGTVVDLPSGWTVSEPGPGRRTALAEDGRRVTVVRTALRGPSDRARVAADLESALAKRGDRRITGLDPGASVAGRDVIGYREQLDAERFVDWYVVVAGAAQLSVGCEAGRTAAPLAGACERAVTTVRPD
ncbi:type VII secretion-associated protein [Tsukamurella sp. 1534]|uniref:type VII secretion-associated protein n=1 Tax=Tsukamurella sp. 1534 TaxID=1151061 RepID=UPI0005953882|nr:type VII secretion-associated protein [Tsukamurella sp. 1534]